MDSEVALRVPGLVPISGVYPTSSCTWPRPQLVKGKQCSSLLQKGRTRRREAKGERERLICGRKIREGTKICECCYDS